MEELACHRIQTSLMFQDKRPCWLPLLDPVKSLPSIVAESSRDEGFETEGNDLSFEDKQSSPVLVRIGET